MKVMKKGNVVYLPDSKKFNGVLIVLREPRSEKEGIECVKENEKWFKKIAKGKELCQKEKMYYNRMSEMLKVCGEEDLAGTAFTNIRLSGGSKNASKEYWKINNKEQIIREIIETVKPKYVFVLKEIFNIVSVKYMDKVQEGLKYGNKVLRKVEVEGIEYYEIYHPAYRRKINRS